MKPDNHELIESIIKTNGYTIGAELGTAGSVLSSYLLETFQNLTLFIVDSFNGDIKYNPQDERGQNELIEFYKIALECEKKFYPRYRLIKKFTHEACFEVDDNSLDFIYIDASHTGKNLTIDMQSWYPKVKEDGVILGHDFSFDKFPDYTEKILEFCSDGLFLGPFEAMNVFSWGCYKKYINYKQLMSECL